VTAGPEGDELIEAIVLELADGARNVVVALSRGTFNYDLCEDTSTLRMSVSLRMYAYF
jgi:hypothetical protein